MESLKKYARVAWDKYRETAYRYPVRTPGATLIIGFALGYWIG
jgi:hypothetical protein